MNYRNFYEFEEYYSIPFSENKYEEALMLLLHANEFLPKDEYEENLFELMIDEARIYTRTNNTGYSSQIILLPYLLLISFP